MAGRALDNVRVIELSESISGPFCGKLLADMGAEVIKVEKPGCGHITRKLGPFPNDVPDPEKSGQFIYLNTNKKSITLDINRVTGRRIYHGLHIRLRPGWPLSRRSFLWHGLIQASGLSSLFGYEGQQPLGSISSYPDPVAGLGAFLLCELCGLAKEEFDRLREEKIIW
jgi:hypothetical protein